MDSKSNEIEKNSVGNGATYSKQKVSTEDVVDTVVEKPTLVYVALLFGLMFFNTNCALVAYFPNFGGYVPYTDWRCNSASEACYSRTNTLTELGWKMWQKDQNNPVFIDSRCSIKLNQFDLTSDLPTVGLWENATTQLGIIEFELSKANNRKIVVKSMTNCKNGAKTCQKEFPVALGRELMLECELSFAGQKWAQKDTTLTCNNVEVTLTDDEGVLPIIDQVKYTNLSKIGSYNFYCPAKNQYTKDHLCGTGDSKDLDDLKIGKDFYWYTQGRTTFAVDWNLFCGGEFLRTMIGSIYFGGAFFGTGLGGTLFDIIGRKKGALIGYAVVIASCFASAASPSIEFLFVCRFFQGFGVYMGFTGMYVLMLEYTASKYRSFANSSVLFFWAVGYLLCTLTGYLIKDWHMLALTSGFSFLLSLIPLLLTPESPRYLLVTKKDVEGAQASLRWLIKLNRSNFDIDDVILEDTVTETKEEATFIDTFKDFWKYKELLIQLVIQMWMWMVAGFIYYGFSFSWANLGDNIYISYLYAAIGEVIAYIAMVFPLEYWGRKPANIMFYLVGSASFLVALIPYTLGGTFTVEQLSCLIGSMFVAAAFGSIYLYTMELAPTSHRGRMLGYCSFTARIGSFCGPQASLMFGWSKTGTLIIFAVLAGLAGLVNFRLPDTSGVATPNIAEEVQERRNRSRVAGRKTDLQLQGIYNYENKSAA